MADARTTGQGPVIIVGTGRCGSTMLHRLLASHGDLGWLSTFNETLPRQHWLSTFSRLYRAPLPDRLKGIKAFPKPFEAYRFWESYLPGFSRRDRPQVPEEIDPAAIEPIRRATSRVLRFQGRKRLLVKVTGWSRIAYFDRIYGDARFISLQRDPRSVVSSWIKAGWLDVTSSPGSASWQWGEVPPQHHVVWEELGGDPLMSTAMKIRLDLDDIEANAQRFPERVHELAYEELIRDPEPMLRRLCEFAGLPWTPDFAGVVGDSEFFDSTETWRKHLSEADGERVLEFLRRTEPPEEITAPT